MTGIPEVWFYRDMEQVQSQRDLASTYLMHYYHALVPNFRGLETYPSSDKSGRDLESVLDTSLRTELVIDLSVMNELTRVVN